MTDAIAAGDKTLRHLPSERRGRPRRAPHHRRAAGRLPGAGCHPGTNLLPIHTTLDVRELPLSRPTPTVTDAIAAGDKRCATCHPSAEADHAAFHDTVEPPSAARTSGCHPGTNLLPIHATLDVRATATSPPTRS